MILYLGVFLIYTIELYTYQSLFKAQKLNMIFFFWLRGLHQLCSHTGKGIVAISAVVSLGVGGESDDDGRLDSSSLKGKVKYCIWYTIDNLQDWNFRLHIKS